MARLELLFELGEINRAGAGFGDGRKAGTGAGFRVGIGLAAGSFQYVPYDKIFLDAP